MNPKMKTRVNSGVFLFTEPPAEEPESLCSLSSLPPPPPGNTTSSLKASEIVTERLLLEVQEAMEQDTGNSECLTTDQAPRVPSPSLSLLEAAADVASSLEDAVDAVIQSSPRARRRKLQLADNSDPMSVLQGGCFSGGRSDSSGRLQPGLDIDWNTHRLDPQNDFSRSARHSTRENSTEERCPQQRQEDTWDENCRQHLADFAEKLSEKLLEEIDQYQKQTRQQPPRHSKILDDHYLSRLSDELKDLTKFSEELQERNSYLAGLSNNPTILETQPPSLLIQDPVNITEMHDPFLETTLYPDVATEVKSNTVVLDLYKQTEKKPDSEVNPAVSNESVDGLSSASDVLMCNSCSRQTSDVAEHADTCVEVVCKGDDCKPQETPQDKCGATQDESIPIAVPEASVCCDSEPGHLPGSVASSVSLRPGYSLESGEAGDLSEQMGTSGSDCSRPDTNFADKTASTVSVELSDAVTGSSSDHSRDTRNTDIQAPLCDGRGCSDAVPPRDSALKAATQEPPGVLTKEESCTSSLSGSTSQESLPSDNGGGAITFHRYYHVFREGELDQLIERYVENLHIISSYYDHANWCVVAEKVHVWTI
jgi:hypothetical protein